MFFLLTLVIRIALGHETTPTKTSAAARNALPCGAFNEVIRQNGGKVPRSKEEWEGALQKFGFSRTEVSFSNGLGRSSLLEPRYLYRITMLNDREQKLPDLTNKLFIAVGTGLDGKPVTEILSFNPLNPQGGLDFLAYEGEETPHLEPTDKCARCHTGLGPLFPVAPWSSSRSATVNFVAFIHRIHQEDPKTFKEVFDELERMRKDPKAHELIEIPNSAGVKVKSFIAELEKNPIFRNTKYQGVPILHEDFRGAAGMGATAIATTDTLIFHQALRALPTEKRKDFLSEAVRMRLEGALGSLLSIERELPQGGEAKFSERVPALQGALYHDRNHVTGVVAKDPDAFPQSEGPPTDKEIQAVLDYDKLRMESFKKGVNPLAPGLTPANPNERHPNLDRFKTVNDVRNSISFDVDILFLTKVVQESASAVLKKQGRKADSAAMKEIQGKLLTAALESEPLQQLYSRDFVPSGNDIMHGFLDGLDFALQRDYDVEHLKNYPRKFRPDISAEDCFQQAQESAGVIINQCARCHGKSTPLYHYVSDLPRWEKELSSSDEKVKATALTWLKSIRQRVLEDKDMPPEREPKKFTKSAHGKELIQFLKRHERLLEN